MIYYYDSNPIKTSVIKESKNLINRAVSDLCKNASLKLHLITDECPMQQGPDDCGVFLLKKMEHLVLGYCCFPIDMNMKKLRLFMALQLLLEKLYI